MKHTLFTYGTLQDPRIQKELFGRFIQGVPAYIMNWGLYMADNGYLFVKPLDGGRVCGIVIDLGPYELSRADLWEDLSVYEREMCTVCVDSGEYLSAFIYTRKKSDGALFNGNELHCCDMDDILAELRSLCHTTHSAHIADSSSQMLQD